MFPVFYGRDDLQAMGAWNCMNEYVRWFCCLLTLMQQN